MNNNIYTDKDCNRLVKRLERKKDCLFSFLEYHTPYPSNASECVLRPFAAMRKTSYWNGAENDARRMTRGPEVLFSIFGTYKLRRQNPYRFFIKYPKSEFEHIPIHSSQYFGPANSRLTPHAHHKYTPDTTYPSLDTDSPSQW